MQSSLLKEMKKTFQFSCLALLVSFLMAPATSNAQTKKWSADRMHSSVLFKVRHILTPFVGNFGSYEVDVVFDENDLAHSSITASLDPASVNSASEDRDAHLKGADFFDVEAYPEAWAFQSTSIEKAEEGKYIAKGTMTAKGKTVEMEIPFHFLGVMDTGRGSVSGITTEFVIKRSDFEIGGHNGGMLGDEVTIMGFLEMRPGK